MIVYCRMQIFRTIRLIKHRNTSKHPLRKTWIFLRTTVPSSSPDSTVICPQLLCNNIEEVIQELSLNPNSSVFSGIMNLLFFLVQWANIYAIGHSSSFSVKITPAKLLKETTAETKMLMQKKYVPEVWMETCLLAHTIRLNLHNNHDFVSQ